MATKNIARTVIEGGRLSHSDVRKRMTKHRAETRAFVGRVRRDVDEYSRVVEPIRAPEHGGFDDKLGPAERWLASHVGRPWDKVYSELRAKFDVRTTAGRHIVFDHMLRWVRRNADHAQHCYGRFFVDEQGILREEPRRRRRREPPAPGIIARHRDAVRAWRSGRRVGFRGTIPVWFVASYTNFVTGDVYSWRQHVRLDEKELTFFRSLDRNGLDEVLLRV